MKRYLVAAIAALLLAACGNSSPGPLAGTWQALGFMPMKTTLRSGEVETMGMIEKVQYKVDGESVIVTYQDGLMKGTSVRYMLANPTTMQAMNITYRKVSD